MPRRLDHIDLRVPNLKQAEPFYNKLLLALGFMRTVDVEGWIQFNVEEGVSEFFGVTESKTHQPNENRIAFWATSNEEVDRLAKLLHDIGAKNIEGPGFDEGPTYYAVFFEDPFGNRLEICHRTQN
ncbi:MAG: VOC family protein [Verrucomicrobiia bacterium]